MKKLLACILFIVCIVLFAGASVVVWAADVNYGGYSPTAKSAGDMNVENAKRALSGIARTVTDEGILFWQLWEQESGNHVKNKFLRYIEIENIRLSRIKLVGKPEYYNIYFGDWFINGEKEGGITGEGAKLYADAIFVLAQTALQNKKVEIATIPPDKKPATISDVDELPSIKSKPNKNSYAIVIGIENYRQKLPKADFSVSDATLMSSYLVKVLGYPEENVITLTNENATNVDIAKYIEEWLPKNIEPNGSVFVYYSGHGAPNPKTGDAFLVPYDGDPNFIEKTGYSLKKLYENLSKLPAKEVVVVLDSCFSGAGGRSVLAQGSRPLVMNLKTTAVSAKNMIVMSASSGTEISSTYQDKGHGLFTYYLLKGIKGEADTNEDGKIELNELYQYLKPNVQKTARRLYNNEQTPQLIAPEALFKNVLLQK